MCLRSIYIAFIAINKFVNVKMIKQITARVTSGLQWFVTSTSVNCLSAYDVAYCTRRRRRIVFYL